MDFALQKFMLDDRQIVGWQANFEAHSTLDQSLLVALAHCLPPMAKSTLAMLTRHIGENVTISQVRTALERLKKIGVLAKSPGGYIIEDKLFSDYIARMNLPR